MKRTGELLTIVRQSDDGHQTLGEGMITDPALQELMRFKTLELPWRNNQRRVSCIPKGLYSAIKHVSPKFGECVWIQNVPGRSEILIHPANYVTQLLGCVAPGENHTLINADGLKDVSNSRNTMHRILNFMPQTFKVRII